jgi:hypothetical protein
VPYSNVQELLDHMRPDPSGTDHANSQLGNSRLAFLSESTNLTVKTLRTTRHRFAVEMQESVDREIALSPRRIREASA